MARLILPRRYSQQPQTVPTLAASGLANGIIDAFVPIGDRWVSALGAGALPGQPLVDTGAASIKYSSFGRGKRYGGGGGSTIYSSRVGVIKSQNLFEGTLLVIAMPEAIASTSWTIFGYGLGSSTNDRFELRQSGTGSNISLFARNHAATNQESKNSSAFWANFTPAVVVGVRSSMQNVQALYVNGLPMQSAAFTALATATFDTVSIAGAPGFATGWTGTAFLAVAWNRALSPAEIAQVSANPWQIFEYTKSLAVNLPSSGTTITPDIFVNAQTFFSPKITETLKPGLFTNSQTFFGPTIKTTVKPGLFTNVQAFFGPTLKATLKPSIFVNSQTFYGPAVSVAGSTKLPSLFVNSNTFYAPTIRLKLYPSIFANSQTFYSPRVATVGSSDFPIGYWELKQAIKTVLDVQLAALSPVPKVVVEDDMIPSESWVGIYQDDRRAPAGVQELSRGKRTRMQVRHTIWVWRYAMKPSDAIRLRDSLLGDVELALMVDPTFGGQCEGSWMNGGRMIAADGDKPGLYYAGGEIELICEALARVN